MASPAAEAAVEPAAVEPVEEPEPDTDLNADADTGQYEDPDEKEESDEEEVTAPESVIDILTEPDLDVLDKESLGEFNNLDNNNEKKKFIMRKINLKKVPEKEIIFKKLNEKLKNTVESEKRIELRNTIAEIKDVARITDKIILRPKGGRKRKSRKRRRKPKRKSRKNRRKSRKSRRKSRKRRRKPKRKSRKRRHR